MTVPGNNLVLTVLLLCLTACTGYAAGRIHQWYRTALERDDAYRDGYDTATQSMFSMVARFVRPRRDEKPVVQGTAVVTSILAGPSGSDTRSAGRHTVPDELVRAATYRLAPDRVARAKVTGPARGDQPGGTRGDQSGGQSPLVAVPKRHAS